MKKKEEEQPKVVKSTEQSGMTFYQRLRAMPYTNDRVGQCFIIPTSKGSKVTHRSENGITPHESAKGDDGQGKANID